MNGKNYLCVFMLTAAALFFSCEQYSGTKSETMDEKETGTGTEAQIIGIKIISPPETTVYGRGGTFSRDGLEVGWLYDDDSIVPMEDEEYLIVAEPDMTKYTVHKVTVKSVDNNYEDSFYIMVMNSDKVLQSVTVSGPTNKLQTLGLDFNKTGLVVTGNFSDGSKQNLTGVAVILGYDRRRRGEQTLTAKVNGKTDSFTITTRIGSGATVGLNTPFRLGGQEDHQQEYKEVWIKGEAMAFDKLNIKVTVSPGGGAGSVILSYGPGGITNTDLAQVTAAYKPNQTGKQTISFSFDDRNFTIELYVVDAEPAVWFDYGYMRHDGDPTGKGPGAGKYYAKPNETLVIAPVRYLIGYNSDNSPAAGTTYNWTVSGGDSGRAYTPSNGGELLHITPKTAGTYTISVSVTGKDYRTGNSITKTASTDLVCYTAALSAGTFASPLRNFGPGQMCEGGTGLGWSLGSAGGYEVWTVEHRSSYKISGNAFSAWHEAGVVWMQEDRNGNGLPDEMWYELRGCDDDDANWKGYITRRYALTYFKGPGHGTVNEYDQLIRLVFWADSRGRTGRIPGGFPDVYWGVTGDRVTYTCTLLRDTGIIATSDYRNILFSGTGYVDAIGDTFYINNAMRADGSPVTLSSVKFIKVQTGIFHYGGVFGDVSTEIHSADFLGAQTDFPLP